VDAPSGVPLIVYVADRLRNANEAVGATGI
jgi:hypothetical protein